MCEVNVYEAKVSPSALLQPVAAGEEIVFTKRNKPIVRLVPFQPAKPARSILTMDCLIVRYAAPVPW
jgi:prevent-host-death family protein